MGTAQTNDILEILEVFLESAEVRKTQDEANLYVYEKYIPDHNKRFGVPAKKGVDAHCLLSDDLKKRLSSIFSVQSKRKVNNDYTIQFKTQWFQLEDTQDATLYKRDEVIVEERLDGTIHIRFKETYLKYRILPARPKPVYVPVVAITTKKPIRKPSKDHPWRRWNS